MESNNPAFRRGVFGQQGQVQTPHPQQLQDMYNAPAYAPPTAVRTMTVDDVVVRGFLTLGTLVVTGALAWMLNAPAALALPAVLVGFVVAMIVSFKQSTNPALVLTFAAAYGVAVGIISHAYNDLYNGVVLQAVIGTALAFGGILAVHAFKIIRVTPKLTRFVVAAGFALVGLMLINLVVNLFGV